WLYDAAGNASWNNTAYVLGYDGYGRMVSALSEATTYAYNAFDQRTRKTAQGLTTRFHYGPAGELLYESQGVNTKAYVYLNNIVLARIDQDADIYYYHTDQLGAPQSMTNSVGAVVWRAEYEPFGNVVVKKEMVKNNVGLQGMYADAETGLYYWGSRYYDPRTGRGTSPDRMSVAKHVDRWKTTLGRPNQPPLEINPYAAFANNPLKWTDPTGEAVEAAVPIVMTLCARFPQACINAARTVVVGIGVAAATVAELCKVHELCSLVMEMGDACTYRCDSDGHEFTLFKGFGLPTGQPCPKLARR
ncbi:MAG: RHS domain-containing protein, partial [Proteobacteria bacterium]|nr:RHS domain-containing protein [Pseudomonadota bacterium]